MRLLALKAATVAVFVFAFSQAPHALAQSYDDSAVGRPPQSDGGRLWDPKAGERHEDPITAGKLVQDLNGPNRPPTRNPREK
jgi:hypothetical protein